MDTKKIAEERIRKLFQEAEQSFEEDPKLSSRYVEIATRIGERVQLSIPEELRKKFCSNCKSFLKPGKNCKVEVQSSEKVVEYRCMECGEVERHGYKE